jgi:hypothetical protein
MQPGLSRRSEDLIGVSRSDLKGQNGVRLRFKPLEIGVEACIAEGGILKRVKSFRVSAKRPLPSERTVIGV